MPYDLYPAVDENYNFPPEVRAALAKSVELRNQIVSMTTTQRNNLTAAEKWDGRFILNTDLDRIQRYDAGNNAWFTSAEQVDAVVGMTEATRDNLPAFEKFDGRLILNLTTDRINRYDSATTTWTAVTEESDLLDLLTDSEIPLPVTTKGSPGVIGTSAKAARADHVHPPAASGLVVSKGLFTTTSELLGIRASGVQQSFTIPGLGSADFVDIFGVNTMAVFRYFPGVNVLWLNDFYGSSILDNTSTQVDTNLVAHSQYYVRWDKFWISGDTIYLRNFNDRSNDNVTIPAYTMRWVKVSS